jgi:putative oxidoreductase
MAKVDSRWRGWTPYLLSIMRIITGFLFMQHGAQKILGLLGGRRGGPPEFLTLPWIAGVLELFGGLLILIGLFTRPVAFILSGLMAVAYFMAHAPGGFWPLLNGGELAALYSFVFLYLSAAGGGPWSLDYIWRRIK